MSPSEASFYVAGGTLGIDVPSYVERQADRDLLGGLEAGEFCYVLTSRQMGKSSLMVRTARRLREKGIRVVALDLTAMGQNLTAAQWYDGMLARIGQQADLEEELENVWDKNGQLSPVQRFFLCLERVLLLSTKHRWVIFVDELDVVRSLPFSTDEFFAAIREVYTRRAQEPLWKRLCFCLLGVATPADLVRDPHITPFNIGRRIELNDFTREEAEPLARGMGRSGGEGVSLSGEACLDRVFYWTNGHPYLTQRLCRAVSEAGAAGAVVSSPKELVDKICQELFLSPRARDRDDNLVFVRERLLRDEKERVALLHSYELVLRGRLPVPLSRATDSAAHVRLAGVVRVDGDFLKVRNRIYSRVFDRRWVAANKPDAEQRRQRTAFWRGVLRAAAGTVLLAVVLGALLVYAMQQNRRAQELARQQQKQLYTAHLNIAQRAVEAGSTARAAELLNLYRPRQGEEDIRGFEWRYLWQLCQQDEVLRYDTGGGTRTDVAFGPSGQLLVVSGNDERIRIFDMAARSLVGEIDAGPGSLLDVRFSPGGYWLVVSKAGKGVQIYETLTQKIRRRFPPEGGDIIAASFLNRGRWLSVLDTRRVGRVIDIMGGKVLFSKQLAEVEAVAGVDPAAHQYATIRQADRMIEIRDWRSQTIFKLFLDGSFSAGAFSPDGNFYAAASSDGPIQVFDMRNRAMITTLPSPRAATLLTFSGDGRRIAAATEDAQIRVWRLDGTPRLERALKGHTAPATSVSFSPEGRHLLSGSADQTARLWDLETTWAEDNQRVMETPAPVYSCTFSPDGKLIASSEVDGTIRFWDAYKGIQLQQIEADRNEVGHCTRFTPDGGRLLTGFGPVVSQVSLWDVTNRTRVATLATPADGLLSWSVASGVPLLVAGTDNSIRVWELIGGRELPRIPSPASRVEFVSLSPQGDRLIYAGSDRQIRLRDLTTAQELGLLGVRPVSPGAGYFFPGGDKVAILFMDGRIQVWSVSQMRLLNSFYTGQATLSIAPDTRTFAAGSGPKVWFWNIETSQEIFALTGHRSSVNAVMFSPDGNALLTSGEDRTLRVWRAPSRGQIRAVEQARTRAASMATP